LTEPEGPLVRELEGWFDGESVSGRAAVGLALGFLRGTHQKRPNSATKRKNIHSVRFLAPGVFGSGG
jgi:hypothetical protein